MDVQDLWLRGIVPRVQSEDRIGNGIEKGLGLRLCVEMGMGDHSRDHGGQKENCLHFGVQLDGVLTAAQIGKAFLYQEDFFIDRWGITGEGFVALICGSKLLVVLGQDKR